MPTPSNLVHQTSTTTGTGNFTLSAVNGKKTFNTAFSTGGTNVFDYFISNQGAAEYERGTGHMVDATTLARDTVIESTNANAAVSFSSGTKDVINDIPAGSQIVNPMSARGDIIRRGSSTYERLGLGSTGQVLKSDNTDVVWDNPDHKLLTSGTVTGSVPLLDLSLTSYTAFRHLIFYLDSFVPATDGAELLIRFSTDGGFNFDAGASDYKYTCFSMGLASGTGIDITSDTSASSIQLAQNVGSTAGEGVSLVINMFSQTATKPTTLSWTGSHIDNSGTPRQLATIGSGSRRANQDTDAVRIFWSAGNWAASSAGTYAIYGLL